MLEPDLEFHSIKAVFDDAAEDLVLTLGDHGFKLFGLFRVLGQISKDHNRRLFGGIVKTKLCDLGFFLGSKQVFEVLASVVATLSNVGSDETLFELCDG